ncbi:MAG: restriction endonuclease subunit S [Lachnospiraceae bacterium]|jgi:type I restriction enzyme S subunit|nr:restriction endonuclease subunit S [Lachnospiraceae bacterium]MCH4067271.1 restriction endonuclease subunit S [Lachnospiraceae bacterium]MCH4113296.1 restriction endonuclease subunit S [Lachnospiraceae bacterium]
MNNMKKPQIRFKGFTDDWEQRKFSEIAQRESAAKKSSTDFPSVEYEDVVSEVGILNKDVRLKETQKTGIGFDGSQVLYGKLRPYLHNWLSPDFSGVAVGDWWVLKPVNIDKSFLFRLIQTEKFDDIANQSSGSKMPRADWNLLSNTEFMVPAEIEEERKIGQYFSDLDHLITLHQRKYEKLQIIKKSMLENCFPKNGEKVPKIRFSGFTGDWEQRKLGEVLETVTDFVAAGSFADLRENVVYKDSPDYAQLVRTVDLKNGFTSSSPVYVDKHAFDYLYRVNLDKESIILPNIGNCGEVYYIIPESLPYVHNVLGPNAILVRSDASDNLFLSILFQGADFQEKLKLIVSPNGQTKFNKTELKQIDLIMPSSSAEQIELGKLFSGIDDLITLHQSELEKLQKIKKSLLERMFV